MKSDLLTKVAVEAGPIEPARVLPGMEVTVTWPDQHLSREPRRLRGQVLHSTLMGLALHSTGGGEQHLTRSAAQPQFQITLEVPFHEEVLVPGTVAAGVDVRGSWQGLWVADGTGRWEAARSGPAMYLLPQLSSLQRVEPVQVAISSLEDVPLGGLALVSVAGQSGIAVRWPGMWRVPAWKYTSSDAHTLALARLEHEPATGDVGLEGSPA